MINQHEEYNYIGRVIADGLVVMGEMYQSEDLSGRREAKAEELRIIMGGEA